MLVPQFETMPEKEADYIKGNNNIRQKKQAYLKLSMFRTHRSLIKSLNH